MPNKQLVSDYVKMPVLQKGLFIDFTLPSKVLLAQGPRPSKHFAEYQVRNAVKPIIFPPIPILSNNLAASL